MDHSTNAIARLLGRRGKDTCPCPPVTMEIVSSLTMTPPEAVWLRSAKSETQPTDQLGRDGMIDAGLVGGDARITITRKSKDDVGFREIFVSLDGEQVAIL